LDKEKTALLLKGAHRGYKTDASILLNTALAVALRKWTGADDLVIELENHGRNLDSIDVSRTVGWFTVMHPILIRLTSDLLDDQINSIKKQFKEVPDNGILYGYVKEFKFKNEPVDVRFNYMGHFGKEMDNELFTYLDHSPGYNIDPDNQITAKMEINTMIINNSLCVEISYNKKAHLELTMVEFLNNFLTQLGGISDNILLKDKQFSSYELNSVNLDKEEFDALFD